MFKHILIISLMFSCVPRAPEQVRCVWSSQFGCACQRYDLNKPGKITDMELVDDIECDDLVGFNAENWATEITPFGRELRSYIDDECR